MEIKKEEYIGNIETTLSDKPSEDKIWLSRSKNASIKLPNSNMNVYDYIRECNKDNLDDVAIEYDPIEMYESTKITYRQLFNMIDKCAKAYKKLGVKNGDIVTVCLPSFVENIVTYYALNKIGAIPNQIHPLASKEEIEFYLEEVQSRVFVSYMGNYENFKEPVERLEITKVLIVDPTDLVSINTKVHILYDKFTEENKKFNLIKFIKFLNKNITKNNFPNDRYMRFSDFMKLANKNNQSISSIYIGKLQAASITHTSGTTGKSKGVLSSHFGYNEMVRQIALDTPILERGDKELLVLPPYPIYVLGNHVHMCLARGITIIVVPKVDYKNIHKYFEKHDITAIQGIPSTINSMLKDQDFENKQIDLSHIKFIVSGGGGITKDKLKEANEFLHKHNCKYNITVGYGMSEMGSCATCTFDETDELGTVGRPLKDTKVRITNPETLKEMNYNEPGEIYLSGPCMMLGYYNNAEATEKITSRIKNSKGEIETWIKTGDIGLMTPFGNLKYIGRQKRITHIIDTENNTVTKLSNDYVEDMIIGEYSSGEIKNCYVVSVADEMTEHAIKSFVVIKNSPYEHVVAEVEKKCKEKLRKNSRPIEYIVLEEDLPETKAGKKNFKLAEEIENSIDHQKDNQYKVRARIKAKER